MRDILVNSVDMGLKLAGLLTSIPAFLRSGETWARLFELCLEPALTDEHIGESCNQKCEVHRFNTDVDTKSMGDDLYKYSTKSVVTMC